jgi:hypothetical protein
MRQTAIFGYLVGATKNRNRNGDTERALARPLTLQDTVDVISGTAALVD